MSRNLTLAATLCTALVVLGACAGKQGANQGPIANEHLGIEITTLPAPFQLLENRGDALRLTVDGKPERGTVEFIVGPPHPSGVNLVTEINAKKPEIEAQPGGKFLGTVELQTPLGTAFTARGRYDGTGGRMEEIWVLALHPRGDRLLSVVYRYPADEDSGKRVNQMMQLVGEVAGTTSSD